MARGNPIDITGARYGRLTALRRVGTDSRGSATWELRCDCGNFITRSLELLRRGAVRSCGCLRSDACASRNRKHGEASRGGSSKEYRAWAVMIRRCRDSNFAGYPDYGGRGIVVCDRWAASFDAFLADVGRAPTPRHTLERINPMKNYESGNVCWATYTEQARNTRRSRVLTHGELSLTVAEWAERTGIPHGVIHARVKLGWTVERALTTPARRLKFGSDHAPDGPCPSRSKEYAAWNNAIHRCHNPKNSRYADYGAKGITVCDRWRASFADFLADAGPAPSPRHTLERVNGLLGYEPGNCRWIPHAEQARNKSSNRLLTHAGETLPLAEWARRTGIPEGTLRARLRYGWEAARALTQPLRKAAVRPSSEGCR